MAPRRKALGSTVITTKATNITSRRNSTIIKTSRASNKRNTTNTIDYTHLQITDVLCPLCRNILIEPITLPCQHCFCWRCLQGRILQQDERGAETCPQCRARFGSWYRTAKKQQKLLTNQPLWNAIREMFLKSDNPLYSFITNGLRKKTTDTVSKIANNRVSKDFMQADDSNDSSCAEDSIRRECNHFKPIDIHRGYVRQSVATIRIPNIIKLPAIRSILCTNGNTIARPTGGNLFSSDPRISAFCLVANYNRDSSVRVQIQMKTEAETTHKSAGFHKKHTNKRKYCHGDDDNSTKLPAINAAIVPLPQQRDKLTNTARNNVVSVSRSKHKSGLKIKRNYRVKQKGAQPQRQSARIVAANRHKCAYNATAVNAKWQQMQADRQMARQLHQLLNSGATRTTKAAQPQKQLRVS